MLPLAHKVGDADADRHGLENLANLDHLPRRGVTVVVGLIPHEQGSGGQARIFASLRSAAD